MSTYRGVPILVTGGSGFIGRWVARALCDAGARLTLAVRDRRRLAPELVSPAITVVECDLGQPGGARRVVLAARPAIVFNLAGYGVSRDERDPVLFQRVNAGLAAEIAAALADTETDWPGIRLVHTGSALEYGRAPTLDEAAKPAPDTDYGRAKLAATNAVAAARRVLGIPALTARLFTVFGPGERPGRLFPTLLAARRTSGRIALSSGTQSRDWTYVEDVADGLLRLGALSAGDVLRGGHPFDAPAINLAAGRLTSVMAFVKLAAREMGIAEERLGFGDQDHLPEEMFHPPVRNERLLAATGWTPPPSPDAGIARALRRIDEGTA